MAPGRLITCVARAPSTVPTVFGLRALTASPSLAEAAEALGRGSLDVVLFPSTSTAYAIGVDAEAALVSRLALLIGVPVLSTCASAVLALRTLGVERIALVGPPWFDRDLNDLGAAYFEGTGFDVVSSATAALTQDPREVDAAAVCAWTARHVSGDAEAIFIGGNGFRAAGAVAALEARLGRPVLTSNQVLLWNLLAEASPGTASEVAGYGRLFLQDPRPALSGRRS